jgi:hypothetical protein
MSDQKWLNCRLSDIRQQLDTRGHAVSKPVISRLLRTHRYSLRANVKQHAGKQHPDRERQFQHLQAQRAAHQAAQLQERGADLVSGCRSGGCA